MRYAAFNCNNGQSLGTTDSARIYIGWQDLQGSTTTSYANQDHNTTLNLIQLGMVLGNDLFSLLLLRSWFKCFLYEFRKS